MNCVLFLLLLLYMSQTHPMHLLSILVIREREERERALPIKKTYDANKKKKKQSSAPTLDNSVIVFDHLILQIMFLKIQNGVNH